MINFGPTNAAISLYSQSLGTPTLIAHIHGVTIQGGTGGGLATLVVNRTDSVTFPLLDLQENGIGRLRVTNFGNVGIGTTVPSSTLHVASGHIQFPFVTAAPVSTECDAAAEAGRVVVFSNTATAGDAQLYVCDWNGTTGAWTVK